jgi:hypothetical protein
MEHCCRNKELMYCLNFPPYNLSQDKKISKFIKLNSTDPIKEQLIVLVFSEFRFKEKKLSKE